MLASRPSRLLRLVLRLPAFVYRLHLGWLFGHRLMLLTHRGRRSGRIHQTVLEVARYDPRLQESIVGSGWGRHADWYRNIQASPPLEVQTGGDCYVPVFRELPPSENFAIVDAYMSRLPAPLRPLAYRLGLDVRGSEDERRTHSEQLLFVAFHPRDDSGARHPRT